MNPIIGKYLISLGALLVLGGLVIYAFGDKFGWLGRLPGDIRWEGRYVGFYFPIVSCIIISLIINLIIVLVRRFFG